MDADAPTRLTEMAAAAAARNGYRVRHWDTRAGTVDLGIPKLREGSYFPDWLLDTHPAHSERATDRRFEGISISPG